MKINYMNFNTDFDLSNSLRNLYNSGFLIMFDRIIVPDTDKTDYITILYNPASKAWCFAKLSSQLESSPQISDIFKNAELINKFKNKNELITLDYISNPNNFNRIVLHPHHQIANNLKLELDLDGEYISNLLVTLGHYNNKSESKEYLNLLPILERLTPSNKVSTPLLFAQMIETINKISVAPKGIVIRKIFDSLIKITNHLSVFHKLAQLISNKDIQKDLSSIISSLTELNYIYSGNEIFPNLITLGGVRKDLSKIWIEEARKIFHRTNKLIKTLESIILFNNTFIETTNSSGIINKEEALDLCLTGSILRASGIDIDFQNLPSPSILGHNGSTWDRYFVRIEEIKRHISFITEQLENIPSGSIKEKTHHSVFIANHNTAEGQINNFMLSLDPIKLPEGDYFSVTESPSGLLSIFIRSDGNIKPKYVSIRNAAKTNILAYKKSLDQSIRSFEYFATSLDINGMDIIGGIYE